MNHRPNVITAPHAAYKARRGDMTQGNGSPREIFIARQPIHDRRQHVIAYEMLFRSNCSNYAGVEDDGLATAQVMLNIMVEIGFDTLLGSKRAFINFPREFLLQGYAYVLPPERVVVEILEDVILDNELLNAVSALSAAGYTIALDDFVFNEHLVPLVELADIIKIDLRALNRDELAEHVAKLSKYRVHLLAEKVETYEEVAFCRGLGFDYFQGYYFCRPEVLNGQRSSTNRLTVLNLLSILHDPNVTYEQLDTLVSRDVTLGYKLLKLVNSSYYGLPNPITSLHQALLLLGMKAIRTWATLLMLAQIDDKPHALINLALNRAWMCRYLGRAMNLEEKDDSLFLVGLFSVLDALLDCPLPEALQTIPLSNSVSEALLTQEGLLGTPLRCVLAYEQGDWTAVRAFGIDCGVLMDAYLASVKKATEMNQALL